MKTLIIDNFDSFTYNLAQYLGELGANPHIFRNDELSVEQIRAFAPSHIVLSPGPGHPNEPEHFGICREAIKKLHTTIPLLGVCLGLQGIVTAFGGMVEQAPEIRHGKISQIFHDGSALFQGISNPFPAMRYHSLIADSAVFPESFRITAKTAEGLIMGLQHDTYPLFGVQFHPESIGTPDGKQILKNFLRN